MSLTESQNKNRHAYLVQTCKNTYVLEKALKLMDDERNDIYIHVDSKCKDWDYDRYKNCVKKSKLFFTQRTSCHWAAYSQLNAMLILCKEAAEGGYSYYHLLSESCLPIKSQDYIHDELKDCEFDYVEMMGVSREKWSKEDWNSEKWNRYYYFFTESPKYRTSKTVKGISRILLILPQKILHIDRWKNEKNMYGSKIVPSWGWNWFTLRDETVKLILSKEEFIKKHFVKTHAPDEVCIPTILRNFTDMSRVRPSRRNIIFDGKPSVITMDDYDRLMNSNDFFARKFDENTDRKVIDKIYNSIRGNSNEQ